MLLDRRSRGQALVEFAMVLPLLLMLLLGIIDFGQVLQQHLMLDHAARLAARLAATGATQSEIISGIADVTASRWNADEIAIDVTEEDLGGYRDVTVDLFTSVRFVTPVGHFVEGLSSEWLARASATFRKE